MSSPPDEDSSLVDLLKQLHELVQGEEFAEAANLCPLVVDKVQNDEPQNDDLLSAVYDIWFQSLLQLEDHASIVQLIEEDKASSADRRTTNMYYLYALYCLKRYEETIQKLQQDSDEEADTDDAQFQLFKRHLHAQSLYHLGVDSTGSLEAYQKLWEDQSESDDRTDILTNLAAALSANALPYVRSMSNSDEPLTSLLQKQVEERGADQDDEQDNSDLIYNVASWQILTDAAQVQSSTRLLLPLAKEDSTCKTSLEWSRSFWSGRPVPTHGSLSEEDMNDSVPAVRTVQTINQALTPALLLISAATESTKGKIAQLEVGLRKLLLVSPEKLKPLQHRLLFYNRAILQYHCNKYADCLATCQVLLSSLSQQQQSSGKKKKTKSKQKQPPGGDDKQQHVPPPACASEQDALWWQSRIHVLQAWCYHCQEKSEQALVVLKSSVDLLQQTEACPVRDHALCYALLHQRAILEEQPSTVDETIQFLKSDLPESIQSQPAVTAALASLYHQQGKEQEAQDLLLSSRTADTDAALADFVLSQGKYEQAAALYEKAAGAEETADDPVALARWVYALTHVDPKRAVELWSTANVPDLVPDDSQADGSELEQREIPRLKMQRKSSDIASAAMSSSQQEVKTNKKSHEAVLRRRARKRDEYISVLESKGLYRADRPTKPDPERWIPKYERSYSRRRRHRGRGGPHKGAQGGISQKDAAKLDVAAARAADGAEGEQSGHSTAHVGVSGGGRRGRR